MGFLISNGWGRVPDNMAYMRELRAFCATQSPPVGMNEATAQSDVSEPATAAHG